MAVFDLYFSDLTPEAQSNILECAGLKDETEANWDCFPITTIEFEDKDDKGRRIMSKIKYNKDFFEFYMSDNSNVQAWQVEETNHWTLEIFPPNQTSESFNKAEFDGWLEISQEPVETIPYSKPTYNRFNINFPPNWTEELKKEFVQSLQQEINEVVVVDK